METKSPLDFDTFKITLITPALLSAADPRQADPAGLRGSSLRGMWRFWARAVWKGLKDNISVKEMKSLEAGLFGDTGERAFRMNIRTLDGDFIGKAYPLPHRLRRNRKGKYIHTELGSIKKGSSFEITIYWPPFWENDRKRALSSIIILWSLLGSLGQRSRRGFGSVRLHDGRENGFFNLTRFVDGDVVDIPEKFTDAESFKVLIKSVLSKTAEFQMKYMNVMGVVGAKNNMNQPLEGKTSGEMFFLQSMEQVFIGKKELGDFLYDMKNIEDGREDREGVIYKVHGVGNAENDEHGSAKPRLASPIYLRVHKTNNGYLPVATINYRRRPDDFSEPFKNWLRQLGLKALDTGASSGSGHTPVGTSATVARSYTDVSIYRENREWEVPPGMQLQKPKRSKQSPKTVWEGFDGTEKLRELIQNICRIDGIVKAIPDMNSYKRSGGQTVAPVLERFNKMKLTCGAADGQVTLELSLTCKNDAQWYYIRREIGNIILKREL